VEWDAANEAWQAARKARLARQAGEPLREIALSYAVDHSTISRLKARHSRRV
jgi:hypothetical protein